jgi:hypothetical protein
MEHTRHRSPIVFGNIRSAPVSSQPLCSVSRVRAQSHRAATVPFSEQLTMHRKEAVIAAQPRTDAQLAVEHRESATLLYRHTEILKNKIKILLNEPRMNSDGCGTVNKLNSRIRAQLRNLDSPRPGFWR